MALVFVGLVAFLTVLVAALTAIFFGVAFFGAARGFVTLEGADSVDFGAALVTFLGVALAKVFFGAALAVFGAALEVALPIALVDFGAALVAIFGAALGAVLVAFGAAFLVLEATVLAITLEGAFLPAALFAAAIFTGATFFAGAVFLVGALLTVFAALVGAFETGAFLTTFAGAGAIGFSFLATLIGPEGPFG